MIRYATLAALALSVACSMGPTGQMSSAVSDMADQAGTSRTVTSGDAGAIAHAINDGEIQLAQLAVSRASSAEVRNFAQMMINDHTMGNQQLEGAAFTMFRSPATDVLVADTHRTMTELQGKSGGDFDRTYIGSQVRMHEMALKTINGTLLPSSNSRLRPILDAMKGQVQTHLDTVRNMQNTMGR